MTLTEYSVPSKYFEPHQSGKIRCTLCPLLCLIAEGKDGVCGTRRVRNGILEAVNFGMVVSAVVDPIEKKPLYHFHPGSGVLSFGGLGCNQGCLHCQNSSISTPKITQEEVSGLKSWSPEMVVDAALRNHADGIAFTYNEPTIWHEWALECCKLAKKNGLYTVYVTNAYIETKPLDEIAPWLDAYAADLKGWGQNFYTKFAKVPRWEKVLDAISRAKNVHGLHVEVTTNVVPTFNDDEDTYRSIAGWIFKELGEKTVWHISRFFPRHKLSHLNPTPVESMLRARDIGLETGLKYVFLGNVHGYEGVENSYCQKCGGILIKRVGYAIEKIGLNGDKCSKCGEATEILI